MRGQESAHSLAIGPTGTQTYQRVTDTSRTDRKDDDIQARVRRRRQGTLRQVSWCGDTPVMAEPFISPLGLTMTPALSAHNEAQRVTDILAWKGT